MNLWIDKILKNINVIKQAIEDEKITPEELLEIKESLANQYRLLQFLYAAARGKVQLQGVAIERFIEQRQQ